MNWYALVDGRLVCIGNCGDWDAACEVADDSLGDHRWTWLACELDVKQWVQCFLNSA